MREFSDRTTLDAARADLLFTVSVLEASQAHDRLLRALRPVLAKWTEADGGRRSADDGIVRANARVAWSDHVLDGAVRAFANELLRDVGGKADHPTFRAFFPEAPSEVVRLGLASEIERVERFAAVAAKVKLSKAAAERLAAVKRAVTAGEAALAQRKDAYLAQAQASLDVAAWVQSANAARVSAFVQLQSWAVENNEDRAYADRFFPSSGPRKRVPPAPLPPKDEKPAG